MEITEHMLDSVKSPENMRLLDALKEAYLNLESIEANVKLVKRRIDEHLNQLDS